MTFSSLGKRIPSTGELVQLSSLSNAGVRLCSAQWQVLALLVPSEVPSSLPAPAQHWAPLLPPPSSPTPLPFPQLGGQGTGASLSLQKNFPVYLCFPPAHGDPTHL